MDPLTQALMQRAMAQQPSNPSPGPPQQGGQVPVVPPASAGKTNTPPELQRFSNAQNMMQAYRNNWTPNPVLLQAQQGK